jgi:Histidine kinase-, DNA gyrase B-, and HSP90-like ATPase
MPTKKLTSQDVVDASPTKEFFIDILVRDVELTYAIAELVDNSVDGAKLLRSNKSSTKDPKKSQDIFKGLYISINFDSEHFQIVDNCGGISVDTARKYAFKFGRIPGSEKVHLGIGTFGVGMKRALFKLGRYFKIDSVAKDSSFSLELDVNKWKAKKGDDSDGWHFPFTSSSENQRNSLDKLGTAIEVSNLHPPVKDEFALKSFKNRLINLIQDQQSESLSTGLEISINNQYLDTVNFELLYSKQLKPLYKQKVYTVSSGNKKGKVTVKILAGLGRDSKLSQAGWYIFCNGRMVLRADKTTNTGWGIKGIDKGISAQTSIPKNQGTPAAHNQFAHFRGFVFFESEDTTLLPWNTAKSGIDAEAPIYQITKLEMIAALREVIDFLNRLDSEKDSREYALQGVMDSSDEVKIGEVRSRSAHFIAPKEGSYESEPSAMKILYHKPIEEFEIVRRLLKAKSAKQVGEKTFEYFLDMEGRS